MNDLQEKKILNSKFLQYNETRIRLKLEITFITQQKFTFKTQ